MVVSGIIAMTFIQVRRKIPPFRAEIQSVALRQNFF